jgi:hypothetical protein
VLLLYSSISAPVIRVKNLRQALPTAIRILTAVAMQIHSYTEETIPAGPVNTREFRPTAFGADFHRQDIPPKPFTRNGEYCHRNDNNHQGTQKQEF